VRWVFESKKVVNCFDVFYRGGSDSITIHLLATTCPDSKISYPTQPHSSVPEKPRGIADTFPIRNLISTLPARVLHQNPCTTPDLDRVRSPHPPPSQSPISVLPAKRLLLRVGDTLSKKSISQAQSSTSFSVVEKRESNGETCLTDRSNRQVRTCNGRVRCHRWAWLSAYLLSSRRCDWRGCILISAAKELSGASKPAALFPDALSTRLPAPGKTPDPC
jgi:hypothetical protein